MKTMKLSRKQPQLVTVCHSVLNQEVLLLPRVVSPHLGIHMAGSV